jgi:hypothetical protein
MLSEMRVLSAETQCFNKILLAEAKYFVMITSLLPDWEFLELMDNYSNRKGCSHFLHESILMLLLQSNHELENVLVIMV